MDLISCKGCGVVLDKDALDFPEDIYTDNDGIMSGNYGEVDSLKGTWSSDVRRYVAYVDCPVCKSEILERGEF